MFLSIKLNLMCTSESCYSFPEAGEERGRLERWKLRRTGLFILGHRSVSEGLFDNNAFV